MAFNNVGSFTLQAGEEMQVGIWWGDGGGDRGAQTIRPHVDLGLNVMLLTTNQGSVIESSFENRDYQQYVYYATISCVAQSTNRNGNPADPADTVCTFSLDGGGNT